MPWIRRIRANSAGEIGWCLYDFGNSITAIIGGIYFANWFVVERGAGLFALNVLLFISVVLVIAVAGRIGRSVDRIGYHIWLVWLTIAQIIGIIIIYGVARLLREYDVATIIAGLEFVGVLVVYHLSRIPFNAFLKQHIAEDRQERFSGLGAFANWLGSLFGLLLAGLVTRGVEGGSVETFLWSAVAFALIGGVAVLLMGWQNSQIVESHFDDSIAAGEGEFWSIKVFFAVNFVSYFLILDVMSTVQRNLPPYLAIVYEWSESEQAIGFLVILMAAAGGGLAAAKFVRGVRAAWWLVGAALALAGAIVVIGMEYFNSLIIAFIVAGACYGLVEAAIRIDYMRRFRREEAGEKFARLAAVERAAGILGPVIWASAILYFGEGATAYRIAMFSMAVMLVVGGSVMTLEARGARRTVGNRRT